MSIWRVFTEEAAVVLLQLLIRLLSPLGPDLSHTLAEGYAEDEQLIALVSRFSLPTFPFFTQAKSLAQDELSPQ
jgi:hypothetical protein